MTSGRALPIVAIVLLPMLGGRAHAAPPADAILATLRSHCSACHGEGGEVNGGLDLRTFSNVAELQKQPALLWKIVEAVRDEEMPPPRDAELNSAARKKLVTDLDALLVKSVRLHAVPPRTPVRRMNRLQYGSTVVDLLDLKVELFSLPERICRDYSGYFQPATGRMPDLVKVGNRPLGKSQLIAPRLSGVVPFPQDPKASNGFDNRADLLTISPILMESFLELSRSIFESPDFKAHTCGKFAAYFLPPPKTEPLERALDKRLRSFLTHAFRRPVDDRTLARYVAYATDRMQAGDDFTTAMKLTASAALASPQFLYLYDGATIGDRPQSLDDYELAARVSFFLWSSGPDDALLADAAAGKLHDPAVLAGHAERLMNDPRMKRFCDAFAAQWLKIEHLVSSEPDRKLFPDFYKFGIQTSAQRGSVHLMLEPLLVFETVFIENRSIADLIQSDFSYRSPQISEYLDRADKFTRFTPGPNYSEIAQFHRVSIESKREGGVITTAGVLAMTSGPAETKPITRGKWIVETLFNDPPPPPPANVPELDEAAAATPNAKTLTLREKFALHATRADCASCHAKIDPFGFALENYDPSGRWRDTYAAERPIDASGTLFHRRPFESIETFKDALLAEQARFARGFAGHLLKYALGRELDVADQPALDAIVAGAAVDNFRLRTLMKQVILSEPFAQKFNPGEAPTTAAADSK